MLSSLTMLVTFAVLGVPAGVIGIRSTPGRLSIIDRQAAEQWCEANLPSAVNVTVIASGPDAQSLITMAKLSALHCQIEIGLGMLTDHMRRTGELPTGTVLIQGGEKLYVK